MERPRLSKRILETLKIEATRLPSAAYFHYPEKVLQFGTGVLLRGLTDFFIDEANKRGIFKGRVVVIKSTRSGEMAGFAAQDNLYTICVRGIESEKRIEENILNASISRVISSHEDWPDVLACASNPELQVIISNTTEVGIVLENDDIRSNPPISFPGKLLAFLYERFRIFGNDVNKGFVIIPTELLPDNGGKLKTILVELANQNRLEASFIHWLTNANSFCSSLVDRIVPGKLPAADLEKTRKKLGYEDELMIMVEIYRLWAIETSSARVREILTFSKVDPGVIIAPDIHIYRELKLRILNGSHTLSCGLGVLAGFEIVREAMGNDFFSTYVESLMKEEIIPCILEKDLTKEMAISFADQVLDRYRNPYLEHRWLSITMQYSSKMRMRDLPLLMEYLARFKGVPKRMTLGWAAHILFMRSSMGKDQQYYGEIGGKNYLVQDNQAVVYAAAWKEPDTVVANILGDKNLWGGDLNELPGFAKAVSENLKLLEIHGAKQALKNLINN
ncbi:MAG: tagaturonate reductase [Chitinophagales bacterium]